MAPPLHLVFFKQDFRCFKRGTMIEMLRPVVPVVGDNGSGKSTLAELIRCVLSGPEQRKANWRSIGMSKEQAEAVILLSIGPGRLIAYDFERDSARLTDMLQSHDVHRQIWGMTASHGEVSLSWLRDLMTTLRRPCDAPALVVLDEPDANLSPRSAYETVRYFREIAALGHQVVATVHNPILITGKIPGDKTPGWDGVLSLEHGRWLDPEEYLLAQSRPMVEDDGKAKAVRVPKAKPKG
jgi:predicted ATPase